MTLLYLDTNVILARYASNEPQHKAAKNIINRIEEGEMDALTSVLTLLEVASVTAKAYERFVDVGENMKREDVTSAFLRKVIGLMNLNFIPMGGEIDLKIAEQNLKFPTVLAVALEIAPKTGLKILDNIHLATTIVASRIYGQKKDYFVTIDEEILQRREHVGDCIEARVSTPVEMVKL
nr:PIN domain-containing protein [Candidatus Njordarchaeum guaymaensis]